VSKAASGCNSECIFGVFGKITPSTKGYCKNSSEVCDGDRLAPGVRYICMTMAWHWRKDLFPWAHFQLCLGASVLSCLAHTTLACPLSLRFTGHDDVGYER